MSTSGKGQPTSSSQPRSTPTSSPGLTIVLAPHPPPQKSCSGVSSPALKRRRYRMDDISANLEQLKLVLSVARKKLAVEDQAQPPFSSSGSKTASNESPKEARTPTKQPVASKKEDKVDKVKHSSGKEPKSSEKAVKEKEKRAPQKEEKKANVQKSDGPSGDNGGQAVDDAGQKSKADLKKERRALQVQLHACCPHRL